MLATMDRIHIHCIEPYKTGDFYEKFISIPVIKYNDKQKVKILFKSCLYTKWGGGGASIYYTHIKYKQK